MTCTAELTIEGVVHDPVIAAVMRADRVDPRAFEVLLRTTQARLGRPDRVPAGILAKVQAATSTCCRPG